MSKKIAFDAGHGFNTPGKRCAYAYDTNETREWYINDKDLRNTEAYLNEHYEGFEIVRLDDPSGREDVPMADRTNKANQNKCDILVSFHHNAGGGTGVIVIRQQNCYDATTIKLQDNVYEELVKANGLKGNRSIPKPMQDLHMCRESSMPAILIENGFMDHPYDTPLILTNDFSVNTGKGIAIGIAKTLGLPARTTPIIPTSKELYRVRKTWNDVNSQLGAYSVLENAKDICDKNTGYSVYDSNGNKVYPEAVSSPAELYRVRSAWANVASQVGAYSSLENAKIECDKYIGYSVFNSNGEIVYKSAKTEGVAYCTVDILNVRDGAGTQYNIQGVLNINEKVAVLNKSSNWRQIRYYNAPLKTYKIGWCSSEYLRITIDV